MYAVGKVGTYIAQGVYTVSGPFHPFGGAVDIIVVQQEDGTFKSSPWYVKFGKFQGVLKRREKKVFVAVNDGDASFHMYLDHKGEAYFLKDAQGDDEIGAISPTEAASSGDEGSSRILALEYAKVEEGSDARGEPSKEESEDERSDDLELRLQASIGKSAEDPQPAAPGITEIEGANGNFSIDAAITGSLGDTELSSKENTFKTITDASTNDQETASSNVTVLHALLTKPVGLQAVRGPALAHAFVPEAGLAALKSALRVEGTERREPASRSGVVIHRLLNLAVGLPASQRAGPATALVASAARASLERVVSVSESNASLYISRSQPKLVEVLENVSHAEGGQGHIVSSSSGEELSGEPEKVVSNPNASEPIAGYIENASDEVLRGLEGNAGSESEVPDSVALSFEDPDIAKAKGFHSPKSLQVRKLEVQDESLVAEVEEHDENNIAQSIANEEPGRDGIDVSAGISSKVGTIVIDRKEMVDKIHVLRDSLARDASDGGMESFYTPKLEIVQEKHLLGEGDDQQLSVQVAKHLVENLSDVLSPNVVDLSESLPEKEAPVDSKDDVLLKSENEAVVGNPDVATAGEELAVLQVVTSTDVVKTAGKDLSLLQAVNVPDVGSPRLKATIGQEMAWRDVMDRAASALKDAPYTRKRLDDSRSLEKKGSATSGSVQKKPDGMDGLPEQSERKSWGGWFWGQPKQSIEQNTSKDQKNVQKELSLESKVPDPENQKIGDQALVVSDVEDVAKSGSPLKHSGESHEGGDSKVEVVEGSTQSASYPGLPTGSGKGSKGKLDDPVESTLERKSQQVQGLPPPRRRFFGMLSRPTPSQSSLLSVSSLESSDEEVALKRETSLERAESVVDLLDAKWARGSQGSKVVMSVARVLEGTITEDEGLMAIARVPEGTFAKDKRNCQEVRKFEGESAEIAAVANQEGNAQENIQTDDQQSSPYLEQNIGGEGVVRQIVYIPGANPSADYDQITETQGLGQEYIDEHQHEIEFATNGLEVEDDTSVALVSDTILKVPISSQSTEMVLMSIDGFVVRAPILPLDSGPPQVSHALCEGYNENFENSRQSARSPRHVVHFSGNLEGRSGLRSHDLVMLGEHQRQQVKGVECSQEGDQDLDRFEYDDCIRYPKAPSTCEGLQKLPEIVAFDNIGSNQSNLEGSPDSDLLTSNRSHLEKAPTLQDGAPVQMNSDEKGSLDTADSKVFEEMRSLVFEKLDEPGDGCDPQEGVIERYYSSKDLQEIDNVAESKVFRRNMSIYMDAISGDEDEAEVSALKYDKDQSTEKSSPIVIPGAAERIRNSLSLDDLPILRIASESLPNTRQHVTKLEVSSPRFAVSRSLDSQPVGTMLPLDMKDITTSFDSKVTLVASTDMPLKGLEKESEDGRITEKNKVEKANEGAHQSSSENRMTATSTSSTDENDKDPEIGFELSLCRHLLTERMGLEAAAKVFASTKVTLDEFKKSGSLIAANDKLVVKVGGRYYPWVVAAPIVLGILAFGQVLTAPNEGDIPVDQPDVVVGGKGATPTGTLTNVSSGGWKLWSFVSMRRPKTPESGTGGVSISRDALMVATEAALKSSLTQEYMRMNGYYKKPRKVRTNNPNSEQLQSLNLREGSNKITFTFETPLLGKQQVDARIYLWKWNTRIVISDVDGTITKSDVLGQFMPLVGKDWTQSGVARLFSAIKKNGYELMFLSARAISQAYLTRQFLENIRQDGEVLPDGPVVISPDGLFPSLYREVIRRAPHEFKIACLEDIKSLFPPQSKPFYAGFGNRDTDELSYLKVGISKGKIFIINPKGEVVVNNQVDTKTYTSLHKLVDDMFPAMTFTEQEDYNEWNFWKLPLPDIEDEQSIKSSGSSSSRRVGKSGRHS